MEEIKNFIGVVAVGLTFFGYIPYIRDTIKGKTKPHIYTWFLWALISFVAFALQISHGAGIGSFVTLAAAIVCFVIFIFGMNTFRFSLGLLALKNYSLVTVLYPLTWLIANGLFSIFLIVRRRQVARQRD